MTSWVEQNGAWIDTHVEHDEQYDTYAYGISTNNHGHKIQVWGSTYQESLESCEEVFGALSRDFSHVWTVSSKASFILFDTEESAKTYISQFPPSVAGGLQIAKTPIFSSGKPE